jgi:hypothetical protein
MAEKFRAALTLENAVNQILSPGSRAGGRQRFRSLWSHSHPWGETVAAQFKNVSLLSENKARHR